MPWTWNLLNSKCIQQVLSNRQRGHAWEKNDHRYLEEILKRNSCWCRASTVTITAEIVDLLSYPETWPKPVSCKALTWVKIPAIHTNLNKFITFNNSNLVKKNLITATEMSWGSSVWHSKVLLGIVRKLSWNATNPNKAINLQNCKIEMKEKMGWPFRSRFHFLLKQNLKMLRSSLALKMFSIRCQLLFS